MITLAAVALTWYLTKVYYTRSLSVRVVRIDGIDSDKLTETRCFECARSVYIFNKNLRTPFYCSSCK